MCRDYGDRDQQDALDARAIDNIRRYGWGVTMIPEDAQGPGWAYTIGLWHSHGTAELAMFGLDVNAMKACLNNLAARAGTLGADQVHHEVIERHPVHLKPIDQRWYRAFFGRAMGFYRRPPVPFLQVVWPDRDGHFVGEPDADPALEHRQPQLWRLPEEHPQGVWTQDL
ncbi:hypothetical protein GCM10010168_19460 [Actinoplanes ianthinogenes]|uniref:DUF4262 domain-containing protein n=2 Tax=Actinoplanes ianthinogenes TaxID=122358 RepID=A0ABM7M7F0_9ACTN|nr:hypothetical protein Aiant_82450 [Actinoplanes ianthinogenes]GGR02789.1 hypothetical protein GCM10010168_19460 [Actinoplanes ianthinogenes]